MGADRNEKSIIKDVLLSLLPFAEDSIFRSRYSFTFISKKTGYSESQVLRAYKSIKRRKLAYIEPDGRLRLSLAGRQMVQPFVAEKLSNDAKLMVIFDIPEDFAGRRQRLRNLLKQLDFKQIQLSVWTTDKDHRKIVAESIIEYELQDWVQMYEAAKIKS